MKVVLVHNTTHYLLLHYTELVETFINHGWVVHCVAPRDQAVTAFESMGVVCTHLEMSRRGMNPFVEARGFVGLYRILRRERPACILNFSIKPAIYGSLAARLAGVGRVCSMITGLGYVFLGGSVLRRALSGAAAAAYRAALSTNYRVFFQNPDDRDFFLERKVVQPGQCVVLPGTGIDTTRFAPVPSTAEKKKGVGFLVIARLLTDKGLREFVEAAESLRSVDTSIRCALLGPFDDNPASISKEEVESWEAKGAISYLGETSDVRPVIAEYDVFVLPSYREGLPRATLEAMSMGKPVVTTDVPGCRETVKNGVNGFLVCERDAGKLKRAMARFVNDPSLIDTMGRQSRLMALERFDIHDVNLRILQEFCDDLEN